MYDKVGVCNWKKVGFGGTVGIYGFGRIGEEDLQGSDGLQVN